MEEQDKKEQIKEDNVPQEETKQPQPTWDDIIYEYKSNLYRLYDIELQLKNQNIIDIRQNGTYFTSNDLLMEANEIKLGLRFIEDIAKEEKEITNELNKIKKEVKLGLDGYKYEMMED